MHKRSKDNRLVLFACDSHGIRLRENYDSHIAGRIICGWTTAGQEYTTDPHAVTCEPCKFELITEDYKERDRDK